MYAAFDADGRRPVIKKRSPRSPFFRWSPTYRRSVIYAHTPPPTPNPNPSTSSHEDAVDARRFLALALMRQRATAVVAGMPRRRTNQRLKGDFDFACAVDLDRRGAARRFVRHARSKLETRSLRSEPEATPLATRRRPCVPFASGEPLSSLSS